jgi:CBS domain-containing protein
MQVRDGMSDVVLTVGPSHTLREAAGMMVEKGIGAALVSDDELPVPCIVTERDILESIGRGQDPDVELVSEHMSEGVVAASPDWSLEHAASEMSTRGIRHLVVFEDGRLVGVLSIRDIVRCWTATGATSGLTP